MDSKVIVPQTLTLSMMKEIWNCQYFCSSGRIAFPLPHEKKVTHQGG